MKSSVLTLGWKNLWIERIFSRKFRIEARIVKEALCYDACSNRYSIVAESIPPNQFYSMVLGARALIDVWPFFRNRMLDIGCGKKPYSLFINSLVNQYIGIDLQPQLSGNQTDLLADGQILPFREESFDTILSTDMLDEIPSPLHLFYEANRILKPDGYFILMVSHDFNIFRSQTVYAHFTAAGLRTLAENSGFNVVVMKYKGKLIAFVFNLLIQLIYRSLVKLGMVAYSETEEIKQNSGWINSFMLLLQKLLLKMTPNQSTKAIVEWDKTQNANLLSKNFHLGYLMVTKKVFEINQMFNSS